MKRTCREWAGVFITTVFVGLCCWGGWMLFKVAVRVAFR